MGLTFKEELTLGGLTQGEAAQAYNKLRKAAFPGSDVCRLTCTAFNGPLHLIHDQVVTNELTLEEGLELAATLPSVGCDGDPPQKDLGQAVVANCVVPTNPEF